jgi:hypothetical protein
MYLIVNVLHVLIGISFLLFLNVLNQLIGYQTFVLIQLPFSSKIRTAIHKLFLES